MQTRSHHFRPIGLKYDHIHTEKPLLASEQSLRRLDFILFKYIPCIKSIQQSLFLFTELVRLQLSDRHHRCLDNGQKPWSLLHDPTLYL